MSPPLDPRDEERFAALARRRLGMALPEARRRDLARAVARAAAVAGTDSTDAVYHRLLGRPEGTDDPVVHTFVAELTVGETYFCRSGAQMELLERHVLPEVLRRRCGSRRLRLWSAGCASGEEAYTLAILVDRLLQGRGGWDVRILATDVDRRALATARAGAYRPWSVRDVPPEVVAACFRRHGDTFHVSDRIRRMVRFRELNLAGTAYPSAATGTTGLDVVLCRNVLMYLDAAVAGQAQRRLAGALAEGGWLVLGHADPAGELAQLLTPDRSGPTIAYRRTASEAGRATGARAGTVRRAARGAPAGGRLAPRRSLPDPTEAGAGDEVRHAETALRQAAEHVDAGRLDDAVRCLQLVLAREPVRAPAQHLAGVVLHAAGDLDGALAAFRRCLYADPTSLAGHLGMAAVLSERGDTPRAHRLLGAAEALLRRSGPQDEALVDGEDTVREAMDILAGHHGATAGGAR